MCIIGVSILHIVLDKFDSWQILGPVILFKINKSLEVGLYSIDWLFSLIISLQMKSSW